MPFYLKKTFNQSGEFRMTIGMKNRITLFVLSVFTLGACDGAKEQIGLTKSAPDEFQVVKHAPLEMPPDYGLRPPRPGAPRPQEQTTSEQASKAVFGEESASRAEAVTDGESALLQQAGSGAANPNIRDVIDEETENYVDKNQPVAQKLLGLATGKETKPASVVDAEAEAERLIKNAEEGKPVTEGETPAIDE